MFFNSYEGGNKLKLREERREKRDGVKVNITLLFEIHTVGTR